MKCTDPDEMWYNELQEPVRHFKETERGLETMCRAFEEYGEEQRAAGHSEGLSEGLSMGISQGISEGISKGQARKAMEIATNLISLGKMSSTDISMTTGLTLAQVRKLEKELKV